MEIILNSFGSSLQRENELFVIISNDGRQEVHPNKVKSICISRGAKISSDAVLLAIEHEIDVLFINNKGEPLGRVWSIKYGSISTIRRKQADFIFSPLAVDWVKQIIAQKITNQIALLYAIGSNNDKHTAMIELCVNALTDYKTKITTLKADIISDAAPSLRGWEGAASKRYFDAIAKIIPSAYYFEGRSQHPATDAFIWQN